MKRCYFAYVCIKDNYFRLFSDNLTELVLKYETKLSPQALKIDIVRKLVKEGTKFMHELRLLSLEGYATEESLLALL